jgi:CubicO group peptidase (beta-lactamase class C family)
MNFMQERYDKLLLLFLPETVLFLEKPALFMKKLLLYSILSSFLLLHACKKKDSEYTPPPPPPVPPIVPPSIPANFFKTFADSLEKGLDMSQFGYAISIYDGNKLMINRAAGPRSRSMDAGGPEPFTDTTRIHVASISKTITALATLKILQEKGISLAEPVFKYLPSQWTITQDFKTVTFRELLKHTSGIRNPDGTCNNADINSYASLKAIAEGPINTSKTYCYQNANFGLLRIILPVIKGLITNGTTADDINTQKGYEAIIQEYIFQKAGVKTAYCEWRPSNALLFEFPNAGKPSFNSGNLLFRSGGLGWYLSAEEVGKVMSQLSDPANEAILSNNWKDSLLQKGYGCFTSTTIKGTAYWHDGLWYRTFSGDAQGMRGLWIKLPANITVVLLVNAVRGPASMADFPVYNTGIISYVVNAYNKTIN